MDSGCSFVVGNRGPRTRIIPRGPRRIDISLTLTHENYVMIVSSQTLQHFSTGILYKN